MLLVNSLVAGIQIPDNHNSKEEWLNLSYISKGLSLWLDGSEEETSRGKGIADKDDLFHGGWQHSTEKRARDTPVITQDPSNHTHTRKRTLLIL